MDLPAAPFDACDQASGQVNSQALVRYKTDDYPVPVAYGHPLPPSRRVNTPARQRAAHVCMRERGDVWVRGYVDQVVIGCGGDVIARHLLPSR